jgi:(S)-citramalyl-CoA lyase
MAMEDFILKTDLNCRSLLCTPITMKVDFENFKVPCDGIILDLEDSIPPERKQEARSLLKSKIVQAEKIPGRPKIFLRLNSVKTRDGIQDLIALLDCEIGPDAIQLPKIESADEVRFVTQFLKNYFPQMQLQLIIETGRGLSEGSKILGGASQLNGLIFGAADFSSSIGVRLNWRNLEIYRAEIIKLAKLNNLTVIDSPFFDIENLDGLQDEVAKSFDLGFSGKVAIHPGQVQIINNGFLPSRNEYLESQEIINEASRVGAVVFKFKGRMIGPPIVNWARKVVKAYQQFHDVERHG